MTTFPVQSIQWFVLCVENLLKLVIFSINILIDCVQWRVVTSYYIVYAAPLQKHSVDAGSFDGQWSPAP